MSIQQSQSDYSHQLQDSNLNSFQTRVYSNNSLTILREKLYIKSKKFIREQHLDINLPRGIIIMVFIFFMFLGVKNHKNNNNEELYKYLAELLGAGIGIVFTMTNLHNQYHYNKLARASNYLKTWNDDSFLSLRQNVSQIIKEKFYDQHSIEFKSNLFNQCHNHLTELKKSVDGIEILKKTQSAILYRLIKEGENEEKEKVNALLNFFEHMGQDVKLQVADSDYLKDYFYGIVIDSYEFLRKYIEYCQFEKCDRFLFCNFVYLAQTWEKEGSLPILPRICDRPLIITSADIKLIE